MATKPSNKPRKPTTDEMRNEIASFRDDPFRALSIFGILQNEDDTLLTRGGGKGLKLYDELERDTHCYSVLQKRKDAVIEREWLVMDASEDPRDVEAAEFVRQELKRIQFDKVTDDLLDATFKGYSVVEIMWAIDGSRITVGEIIPRQQRRFVFGEDRELRKLTTTDMIRGEVMPDRKFIVHTFGGKDGSPYGLGLGTRLFWPVFFKRQDIKFWLIFLDKYGCPTAVGKYPSGASPGDQKKLRAALGAIAQDTGITIPEGMIIELLESKSTGNTDAYEKFSRYMDEQMSICVLGETLTTTVGTTGGNRALGEVHAGELTKRAKRDADLLSGTLNRTLVRWLVEYNFPGALPPTVWRDFSEPEDLVQRATRDKTLREMGADFTEEYIRETYGEGVIWKVGQPRPQPQLPPGAGGFAFAEGLGSARKANREDQAALAEGADALSGEWKKLIGKRVEDLVSILEATGDLKLFRERLDELLAAEPPEELVQALQRAGFAAHLAGRTPRNEA